MRVLHGVAPPDLIRKDFKALDARETLRTTWENEELILLQSVQGHAHEGHGLFSGRRFPNTSLDDVTWALRLDPTRIRAERQALIDSIGVYVERVLKGETPVALLDQDDKPLLGISTLRYLRVEPRDVLSGLYLGGLRDDSDVRLEVERQRGIRIGGGHGYPVDTRRMVAMGLHADVLAHGEWADEIARFRKEGLIVEETRIDEPDVDYLYIRDRRGPGASDDAAIVAGGMLWGLGVAVGIFFADAIDTLEKYVPVCRDQDNDLARHIEQASTDLHMGIEDVKKLIYLAANSEEADDELPDSSLRHLLAIDRHVDLCPLEAHLLAVQGVPAPSILLGNMHMPSARFYRAIRERVERIS